MTAKPNLWVVLSELKDFIEAESFGPGDEGKIIFANILLAEIDRVIVEYAPVEKRENATERAARLGFNLESATGENIDVITGKRFDDE